MLAVLNPLRELSFVSLLLRLGLATFCGTLIGLERSAKNRPAGFRTHILVCLGAAVAALTGHFLYLGLHLPADVTRLGGQVITGLGFIGAGTIIITKKMSIQGLTTAAGLWSTGIIGIAIGSGYFEGGLVCTVLVLLAETAFFRLGRSIRRRPDVVVVLQYSEKTSLDAVLRYFKDRRMSIKNLQIHSLDEHPEALYEAAVTLRGNERMGELLPALQNMPGIVSVAESQAE